jgi:hypothetical protein
VNIEWMTIESRPLAKQINDWFALAGWKRQLGDNAQPFLPYLEGTRVQGYNATLVDTIAAALRSAGVEGVNAQHDAPEKPETEAKMQQTIWITVGYPTGT